MKPYWELEIVMHSDGERCSKCRMFLDFGVAKLVKTEMEQFIGRLRHESFCMKCGAEELLPQANVLAAKRLADMGYNISAVSSLVSLVNSRNSLEAEARENGIPHSL
jgi:hypothetical protein